MRPATIRERLETAFDHGADVVVFDLEDGVPPDRKDEARELVAGALRTRPAWVRVNPAGTAASEADLRCRARARCRAAPAEDELAGRRPLGARPHCRRTLICSIESAQGVAAAPAIAAVRRRPDALARQP